MDLQEQRRALYPGAYFRVGEELVGVRLHYLVLKRVGDAIEVESVCRPRYGRVSERPRARGAWITLGDSLLEMAVRIA